MTEERLLKLPHSWVWLNVGEVIEKIPLTGKKLKQSEYKENGRFPVIDQGQSFIGGFTDNENLRIIVKEPVIIFGDHTKVFKYVNFNFVPGADGVKVLKPEVIFNPKLFYYFLQSIPLPEKGYARHFQWLEKSIIPLPPLPEQPRIVAKIEELFTKLDAGVEALKKVKAQLKRYRQAVLKYAFEGKLTQEWREANKDKLEPTSVLLERIKEERKKKTEGKFKEFLPVDTTDLPELAEGWAWTRIGEVTKKIQYGTSEKAGDDSTGIPVIRMGNIFEGKIIFDNLKYFDTEWPQLNDFLLKDGDVLFNRTNSMELVGKTAVYKKSYPEAIFASYLIRISVDRDFYNPDLLSFFINSFYGRQYIASVVSQQVGQANVNGTKLSLMPIPLPSFHEQKKIVEEMETCLSMADEMEKITEQTLKQSERLRQSILKTAFEGKLAPQDPTDEPAEKLLERIKAEKAKRESETKIRPKKSNQMELM